MDGLRKLVNLLIVAIDA